MKIPALANLSTAIKKLTGSFSDPTNVNAMLDKVKSKVDVASVGKMMTKAKDSASNSIQEGLNKVKPSQSSSTAAKTDDKTSLHQSEVELEHLTATIEGIISAATSQAETLRTLKDRVVELQAELDNKPEQALANTDEPAKADEPANTTC